MKRKWILILIGVSLLFEITACQKSKAASTLPLSPEEAVSVSAKMKELITTQKNEILSRIPQKSPGVSAIYLGVKDYGLIHASNKDSFQYYFSINGEVSVYSIANSEGIYAIQNQLMEGHRYQLTLSENTITGIEPDSLQTIGQVTALDDTYITINDKKYLLAFQTSATKVTSSAGGAQTESASVQVGDWVGLYGNPVTQIDLCEKIDSYQAPVSYTPGERTLKNFLATALQPVGTTLYVYGGGWNWQDDGSSIQSTSIGLPDSWVTFFQNQDANYTYDNKANETQSYFPSCKYNEYYYVGADCSGYVGWTIYNVMNTSSGNEGYVGPSTEMARKLSQEKGFGSWTQKINGSQSFHPGDIFSMNGHVWICLGTCSDGSMVILHSTPTSSKNGRPGGGVQLSAVSNHSNCQATQLVQKYMGAYYPEWSNRYEPVCKSYSQYTAIQGNQAGRFSWNLDESGLTDPDNYATKNAEEILKDLFGE